MYIFVAAAILALVVSIDLFTVGFANGAGGVKVSFFKIFIINIVGKVLVAAALIAGFYLGNMIPDAVGTWLSFCVLTAIGLYKIVQSFLPRRQKNEIISGISVFEAVALGIVLSLDNMAASLGAMIGNMPYTFIFAVLGVTFITDQTAFFLSNRLGILLINRNKSRKFKIDWLGGVILIAAAVIKLLIEII